LKLKKNPQNLFFVIFQGKEIGSLENFEEVPFDYGGKAGGFERVLIDILGID